MSGRFWFFLKLVLTLAVLWGCFRYVGSFDFVAALRDTSLSLFLLAAALNAVGTIVIPAAVTKIAVQGDRIAMSLRQLIALNFVVRFYVLVLPRAAAMALRWWRYRQAGRGDDALALMIFERVTQLVVMMGAAALLLGLDRSLLPAEAGYLWMVALLAFLTALLAFSLFIWPAAGRMGTKLLRLLDPMTPSFARQKLDKLVVAIQAFHSIAQRSICAIIGLSIASFLFFVLSPYVIAQGMGLDVSLTAMAWIRALVFLVTLIPITVGGIGVREAGFIALLQLYGVSAAQALAFSLTLLAIQLALGAIGALLELWRQWLKPGGGTVAPSVRASR